jgi:DNA invertase Pin-like site-specific DNA recombinase
MAQLAQVGRLMTQNPRLKVRLLTAYPRRHAVRSLREAIDTSNAPGRMVAGVLASLAELELELGRERRAAAREARRARGQHVGRPKALDEKKAALAMRMHGNGESASTIANTLGVSPATVYRVLAEQTAEGD